MRKNILRQALQFATIKHKGQTYNGQPYIIHPIATVGVLASVCPQDEALLAAGYLHDTLEDTKTTYKELKKAFNQDIADLVLEVTKDKDKNFPNLKTDRGLMLKVADRMANVSSATNNQDVVKRAKLFRKYSYCFIHEGSILKEVLDK